MKPIAEQPIKVKVKVNKDALQKRSRPELSVSNSSTNIGSSKLQTRKSQPVDTKTLYGSNSKSLNAFGRKTRPPLVSASFTFRTEERAKIRREQLEAKNNEAKNSQLRGKSNKDSEMKRTVSSSSNKRQTSSSLKSSAVVKNDYIPKSTKNIVQSISKEKKGGASKPHHSSINIACPTIGDSRAGKSVVKQSKDKWIQQTSRRAFVDISNNSTSSLQLKSKRCMLPFIGSKGDKCTKISNHSLTMAIPYVLSIFHSMPYIQSLQHAINATRKSGLDIAFSVHTQHNVILNQTKLPSYQPREWRTRNKSRWDPQLEA